MDNTANFIDFEERIEILGAQYDAGEISIVEYLYFVEVAGGNIGN